MKSVLVIAFTNLEHDARVNRQIDFLKDAYSITVATFNASNFFGLSQITLPVVKPSLKVKLLGGIALLFGRFDFAYQKIYNLDKNLSVLNKSSPDIIIANDIETLPLAVKLSQIRTCKILFDAHEYAPRHFEEKFVWRLLFKKFNIYLCRKYIPCTSEMITVGQGLAKEYEKNFGIRPKIITNANYFHNIEPIQTSAEKIRLVYHGAANPSRQLELMIQAMTYVDERFTLDLILLTPPIANRKTRNYLQKIKQLAELNPKVSIRPAVKSNDVIKSIHQYDVGVFLLPPVNFNYENTLPNKLFDYIQARLAIAIGPSLEMANVVKEFDLGIISDDFTPQSFGKKLNSLTDDKINYFKSNSHVAAITLNSEQNKQLLSEIVSKIAKTI